MLPRIALLGAYGTVGTVIRSLWPANRMSLIGEGDDMRAGIRGCEALVHVAGTMRSDLSACLANLELLHRVIEAARAEGVSRIVYASSVHADPGLLGLDGLGFYGAGKVASEAILRAAADQYGMGVACLRLGAVRASDNEPLPVLDQSLRLYRSGLLFHLTRALAVRPGEFRMMLAVGRAEGP